MGSVQTFNRAKSAKKYSPRQAKRRFGERRHHNTAPKGHFIKSRYELRFQRANQRGRFTQRAVRRAHSALGYL